MGRRFTGARFVGVELVGVGLAGRESAGTGTSVRCDWQCGHCTPGWVSLLITRIITQRSDKTGAWPLAKIVVKVLGNVPAVLNQEGGVMRRRSNAGSVMMDGSGRHPSEVDGARAAGRPDVWCPLCRT